MNRTRALVAILLVTGSLASAAIEQQQQAPPPAQLADARVMALIGQTASALTARNFGEAMAKADESIALAETLGDRVGLAMSFLLKGRVFNRQSRFADSPPWYERALKEFEALGNKKGTADALAGIASAASGLGDKARAKEAGNRAVKLYEELGDDRARADTLYILVFSDAEPELREARLDEIWRIAERLDDDLFRAQVLRSRASGFFMASDFANAKTTYEAAIALFEKTDSIADKAATYLAFGRVFRAHGDYEGAIERYQKAIDLLTPTNERYALVEAYNAKAIALQNLKRPKEALAAYEHGLALARESRNQSLIDFMEGNIPAVLIDLGEYERAVALLEVVIARKPDRHTLGYRYNALSNALTGLGRWADSLTALDQSIEIAREFKQPDVLQSRLFLRVNKL
jgi:tetratricopeptide (TPR) repeat protein